MNSRVHDHFDFELKTQKYLVETAILKAGGISLFAEKIGVNRHTVSRWATGKHSMSGQYVLKLIGWLKANGNG